MEESKNDFTSGNIAVKLVRFMLPVFGALVLQAMYGAVDVWVVGQFGTTDGLSGVSTGSSIVNLVVFTIAGFSMAVTVLISQYIGEGRNERIGRVIGGAICFFTAASLVVMVLMLVLARPMSQLMQAPESALDETILYVRICGGGILFIIAYNLISGIFRGLGNSTLPLIFVLIACVVNIVGDIVFVAVLKMDVAGAALATVMAQAVSVVLSLIILRKQKLPFHIAKGDICFNEEILKFARIGAPIALQEILTETSFLALCAFINRLGPEASAGYGIANKVVSFVMLVPSSLMQSMSAVVGQNVGAGKEKRARQAMFTGMAIGCGIGVFICAASYFGGYQVAGLFANDKPEVVLRAAQYLKGFAPEAIVTSILFSYIGYYNGHGKTLFVMIQGLAQTLLVRLPMSFIMSIQPDASLTQIGWAAPSATVFGIVINTVYFIILLRQKQQAGQPANRKKA